MKVRNVLQIDFVKLIAPSFYECLEDVLNHRYTHYWLKGGRGSTKSSFISLVIILLLMLKPKVNALALRKVGDTLKDSVYAQLLWAINALGVAEYWQVKVSPLQLKYKPNGNVIMFRGVDDPLKIKSIKASQGYFGFVWFEELAEFAGMDEVNNILQSVMRGGEDFWCFCSYNPPASINSWVNEEVAFPKENRKVYHSTYLEVPKEWLGEAFIVEAEHMKSVKLDKYRWQYLGEVIGTGGEVFHNVKPLAMSDEMIKQFDNVRAGLDWGWSIDPLAYVEYHRDTTRKILYIYHEFYALQVTAEKIAKHIRSRELTNGVIADCADPRAIAEVRSYGVRITGCTKNKSSRERTYKHLSENIETIYIDPVRCPNTYREFTGYELERDRYGNFKAGYPEKNDHAIDAVRYGEDDINYSQVKSIRANIY